jgi:putative membrane protein
VSSEGRPARSAGAGPGLCLALLALVTLALGVSAIRPHDAVTWLLEVLPVLIAAPILVATRRRFPLTPLLYCLIAAHALVLILGAHYTYARVPLGYWLEDWFGFARNHYDRIGHLMQGFVPAIVARELLLRKTPLRPGAWLFTIVTLSVLGISALYEFTEWWVALAAGTAAGDFLGTQGDPWDTQWDMFMALCGALAAQLLLARLHDTQLLGLAGSGWSPDAGRVYPRRWLTDEMALLKPGSWEITYRWARRIAISVVGGTVLAIGVAMIVLPGPALVVIPLGLAILGVEYAWARRWLRKVKARTSAIVARVRNTTRKPDLPVEPTGSEPAASEPAPAERAEPPR